MYTSLCCSYELLSGPLCTVGVPSCLLRWRRPRSRTPSAQSSQPSPSGTRARAWSCPSPTPRTADCREGDTGTYNPRVGNYCAGLDTGLDDGEVAGQVRLDQVVGGVGGKAGLEGGGGLCGQVVDHSLSSGMML